MKALLSRAPGGPDTLVLDEIPAPRVGAGQLLLEVRAVGVNYPDVLIIQDLYQYKPPRPFSPGGEISGVVREVGPDVAAFKVGDRVVGLPGSGGMAELVAVDAKACAPIPPSMPFDEAAAFPFTYGTSYHALKQRAALKAGETLLVLGAAGGVGIAAVELGKCLGARVVAAASSQEKIEFAKRCGADETVVYPRGALDRSAQTALSDAFKQACGGGADVVYDAVGGDYAEPALRALNWTGRFLVVGFPAGIPRIALNLPLLKGCQIVGVFWGAWVAREPAAHAANMRDLLGWYLSGKIRPRISARFPLERGGDAIRELAERRALGKVVVTIP
ncbi:MAG: NADPH:quinone oxidoreductase family protein [Steroidobacteraceae bacterium]